MVEVAVDMLLLVQEVLVDMAMSPEAAALTWSILSERLDRKEVVWLLKRILGLGKAIVLVSYAR